MMVSTKGRYALRVMVDLAENMSRGYVAMREIAARQEISLKYLEKILPDLVEAGFVEGLHGRNGGYRLTRQPEDYTVGRYCARRKATWRLWRACARTRRAATAPVTAAPAPCGKDLTSGSASIWTV